MSHVGDEYEEAGAVRVCYGSMDQPGAPEAAPAPMHVPVVTVVTRSVVAPGHVYRNFSVSEDNDPGMLEPGQSPLLSTNASGVAYDYAPMCTCVIGG